MSIKIIQPIAVNFVRKIIAMLLQAEKTHTQNFGKKTRRMV